MLTFPEFFRVGPEIACLSEPDGDEGGTDGEGDEETEARAEEDLPAHAANEPLGVHHLVLLALEGGLGSELVDGGAGVVRATLFRLARDERGSRRVGIVVRDLLDETKEDGDDDGRLEGLTEDDEEDGDGEHVLAHGACGVLCVCR